MAFSYSDALVTNKDQVRLLTGDSVEDQGPRPDGRNFSDNEITYYLSQSSSSVEGAVARIFETLAGEWAQYALMEREGDITFDAKEVAEQYKKRANEWYAKAGGGGDTIYAGMVGLDFQQTDTTADIYN